jgi:hypothetical protein
VIGGRFVIGGWFVIGSRFVVLSWLVVGGRLMIRGRFMIGSGLVVWSRRMIRGRCVVGLRLMVRWGWGMVRLWLVVGCRCVIGFGCVVGCSAVVGLDGGVINLLSAVHVVLVVTGAQVLIEDGSVPTLECILLPIRMTEIVDLTTGLRISIMFVRVGNTSTVKLAVPLGHSYGHRLDRFHLVGPLL